MIRIGCWPVRSGANARAPRRWAAKCSPRSSTWLRRLRIATGCGISSDPSPSVTAIKPLNAAIQRMKAPPWPTTTFPSRVMRTPKSTLKRVAFYIGKARFYDRFRDAINERQSKAIARMFREGPSGFKGGLSAENYIAITRTSRATATRDLHDLVEKGALTRTGERRHTRYGLNLPEQQSTE